MDKASDYNIESDNIVISEASEVLEQLKELEELRLKVEAARKEKEEKERLAREEEERFANERKKRLLDFELMEEQNDSDSDDESTKNRRLQKQREFEEKKRRRERRKGLRGNRNDASTTGSRNIGTSIKTNEAWIASEAGKEVAREEKIESTKAEIEAERNKIAELTRIIQLEKEMSKKLNRKKLNYKERQLKKQGYCYKKKWRWKSI